MVREPGIWAVASAALVAFCPLYVVEPLLQPFLAAPPYSLSLRTIAGYASVPLATALVALTVAPSLCYVLSLNLVQLIGVLAIAGGVLLFGPSQILGASRAAPRVHT